MKAVNKRTFALLWHHTMRYKLGFFTVVLAITGTTFLYTLEPLLVSRLFDSLVPDSTAWSVREAACFALLALLVLTNQALWRLAGFTNARYQPRYISDILVSCYASYLKRSMSFFANNFIGALVTRTRRLGSSAETIDDRFKFDLFRVTGQCLFALGFVYYELWDHPEFGISLTIWAVVFAVYSYWFSNFKLPYDAAIASQETKMTAHLADTLTNIAALKVFAKREDELRRFVEITQELARRRAKSWTIDQVAEVFQSLGVTVLRYGLLFYAIVCYKRGEMTIGQPLFVYMITGRVSEPLWDLGRNIRQVFQNLANAEEPVEDMARALDVVDKPGAVDLQVTRGRIEFRNVCMGYVADRHVFKNLSFTIEPGTTVALVGPSGCGKSTIVNALFRFWEIQCGQILIDDQEIAECTIDSVRRAIAYVPQEPSLFHRTLHENIGYGRDGSDIHRIKKVSRAADCDGFIEALELGYDTEVGERGVKLSGGQRQRVVVARALNTEASILVMDEATSSLDNATERRVKEEISSAFPGKTKLIIAHRLTTIRDADRIIYIGEDHTIQEDGTHDQLMAIKGGQYASLYNHAVEQAMAHASM